MKCALILACLYGASGVGRIGGVGAPGGEVLI